MKCKICKKGNLIYVGRVGEKFCDTCTKCPRCGKESAIVEARLGILPGKKCQKKHESHKTSGRSMNSKLEYLATPYWKHAGHKIKPHEKEEEKRMKYKGLSYLDMQKKRGAESREKFDSTNLKRRILSGNAPKPISSSYGK